MVTNEDVPHLSHLYRFKKINQFSDDLDFLLRNYSPTSLTDVIKCVRGGDVLPPGCILLTFDDGFREIYDIVAPILLTKGFPATFFLSSAFLDNRELCYLHKASLLVEKINHGISRETESEIKVILRRTGLPSSQLCEGILQLDYRRREALEGIANILQVDFQGYLAVNQPYLTSSQIEVLIGRGFTVGAHSIDHPYYSSLSLSEQIEQTLVSITQIRQRFSLDYGAFAFPHNDSGTSRELFRRIQEDGLIDLTFGTGGMVDGGSLRHRQRISMEKPLLPAQQILAWQYLRNRYKKLMRKNVT